MDAPPTPSGSVQRDTESRCELLDAGDDIKVRNEYGWTPLHLAIFNETSAIIELLLDRGANAKAQDKDGHTPFDHAKDNEQLKGTDVYWRLNAAQYR